MKVKLHEPTFGREEINAAVEVMESTMVTQGDKVREFEQACATKFGFERAVVCNSGSSANLLAVAAMSKRLEPGDEVLVPALSWPTTIWPIVQCGLVPVFCDCDPDTLNMVVEGISPRTKAIMPVHVYGNPFHFELYTTQDLYAVEDCCEAMGAPVGGTLGTFSFYYSHHITTFEGGMVGVDDPNMADDMRVLRSHGWIRDCEDKESWAKAYPYIDPKFLFVDQGYNLRMTEVAAAIGLVQLPKLDGIVEHRRWAHKRYMDALGDWSSIFRFQNMHPESSCFSFAITLRQGAPFSVDKIREFLESDGIETRPIIAGNMAEQPGMQKFKYRKASNLSNANHVMRNGFSIGIHTGIGADEIGHVHDTVAHFMRLHA